MATKPPALGIIDSLSAGFESINRIIWVLLFPLLLDLFLWAGPQLSVAPIIQRALSWYDQAAAGQMAELAAQTGSDPLREVLEGIGGDFNLFRLLTSGFASIPSAVNGPLQGFAPVSQIDSIPLVVFLVVGLELLGTFVGCLYLGVIAQQVRDGRVDLPLLLKRVWSYWLSMLGCVGLLLALGLSAGIASSILIFGASLISAALGTALALLLITLWWGMLFVLLIFTYFVVDAVVVSQVGPWKAFVNSITVVSRNFGSSVGLILLLWVIMGGTQVIWSALPNQTWGTLAAIPINAYVGSGVAAASLTFYQSRLAQISRAGERGAARVI